jgi:hypothetical protein
MSAKNLEISMDQPQQITKSQYKKMIFIQNALEQGWSVKKSQDSYIFTKKHENRREIFQENYLETFLVSNFSGDFVNTITERNGSKHD